MSAIVEIVETPAFNASFAVTDLLMKTLENAAKNVAIECIKTCATQYSFDAEEAIKNLGLENLGLTRKPMAKRTPGVKKEKTVKEPKAKKETPFPLPYCSELIKSDGCHGISYNHGLFTQCPKKQMENGSYCKTCQADADTNASAVPTCGNVEMRLANGLYEYKDTKGRSPINYLKVLTKMKLTKEQALEAAEKANIILDDEHFQVVEKAVKSTAGTRGRPKKPNTAVTADGAADLFAQLQSDSDSNGASGNESDPAKAKRVKLTPEEKEAKKAALEAERAEKKAIREAEAAAKKAERETKAAEEKAEREAKRAQEKAEREAKKNQEKAEKEQKKADEKAAREAKKAALEAEKAKKEAEKEAKKKPVVTPTAPEAPVVAEPVVPEAPAEKPQKVTVTRTKIDGKEYLKSSTNILYDAKTREEVGIYDPETKTIKPLPDDDEEEEEDYESEEN